MSIHLLKMEFHKKALYFIVIYEIFFSFDKSTLTKGRQSVIIGKENFPLDCSEWDVLHMAINKYPEEKNCGKDGDLHLCLSVIFLV